MNEWITTKKSVVCSLFKKNLMNFHAGINTGNEGIFWLNEVNAK